MLYLHLGSSGKLESERKITGSKRQKVKAARGETRKQKCSRVIRERETECGHAYRMAEQRGERQ